VTFFAGVFHRDGQPVSEGLLRQLAEKAARPTESRHDVICDGNFGWIGCEEPELAQEIHYAQHAHLIAAGRFRLDDFAAQDGPDSENENAEGSNPASVYFDLIAGGKTDADWPTGDFAGVVFDAKEQRLHLFRDHLGVRTIFYFAAPDFVVFSSDVPGVLAHPDVPRELNESKYADYLAGCLHEPEATLYKGVTRLQIAGHLTIGRDNQREQRYWKLDPNIPEPDMTEAEMIAEFRRLLEQAIERRRPAGVTRVAAAISGGLDSSSIAAILATRGEVEVVPYSLLMKSENGETEEKYIRSLTDKYNLPFNGVVGRELDPFAVLLEEDSFALEPFIGPNIYLHFEMYRRISESGLRYFFEGLDGDTTVSHGTMRMRELASKWRYLSVLRELKLMKATGVLPKGYSIKRGLKFHLRHHSLGPLEPAWLKHWRLSRKEIELADEEKVPEWINPDLAERVGLQERLTEWSKIPQRNEREHHYALLHRDIWPFVLECTNWLDRRFGVRGAYPYFDVDLVKFCYSLPPRMKLQQGWTRYIQREACRDVLSKEIYRRPDKSNLGFELSGIYLKREATLRAIIGETEAQAVDFIDLGVWEKQFDLLKHQWSRRQEEAVIEIWRVAMASSWLKHF
jgi:asparagine synthase (glutamine-hydrolysing)